MSSVTCSPGAPVAFPTTIVALHGVWFGSRVGPAVGVGPAVSADGGVGTGVGGGVGVGTRVGTAEDIGSDVWLGGDIGAGLEVVGGELTLDVGVSNPAAADRTVGDRVGASLGTSGMATAGIAGSLVATIDIGVMGELE